MKAAGCHEFSFAPESGDSRVLKSIKKMVNLDHLFVSARSAMSNLLKDFVSLRRAPSKR
jgi:radical SAM superfamily enzyme YgiQ (UPF0313 family)